MTEKIKTDICILGAGAGGLSVAAGAAAFGRNVVLIEKHKMGGDCLNYGCVPSKALLAVARRVMMLRTSSMFGIKSAPFQVDPVGVYRYVHSIIEKISVNDSEDRFQGLGVRVLRANAQFVDKKTVAAGDYLITARRFVIATGSSPLIPPIPGLDKVSYLTNETLFDLSVLPEHLLIVGGGPIGLEMAQAYARLGSKVTVLEAQKALKKDDHECVQRLLSLLRLEGVDIWEDTGVEKVETHGARLRLSLQSQGSSKILEGSHLLIAAGRRPNISELNLSVAGVKIGKFGIEVDQGLRTSNKKIFALGDVIGGSQFTHVANYHATIILKRILFRWPAKVHTQNIPWVTYTDPELAHVGLSEAEAQAFCKKDKVRVLRWSFFENDRAQTESATDGHIKVLVSPSGQILGVSLLGAHAGELIQMWVLAISQKLNIKDLTGWISPYPTLSEISKRAAFRFYTDKASSPIVRKLINFLAKFG